MRTKYVSALVPVALVLQLSSAWAAPERAVRARWEEAVEPQSSRIIVQNLSAVPAEVSLGSEPVVVTASGRAELPAASGQIRSEGALLVVQAPDGFDAASLQVDKSDSPLPRVTRKAGALPDWARELAAGVPHLRHGMSGAATVAMKSPAARAEVAVEFLAPHTRVRIRQLDAKGNEVTSLVASASRPVRWRAVLEPVGGESRIEIETLRGEAQATAGGWLDNIGRRRRSPVVPMVESVGGGLAKFEPTINWQGSGNMVFKVTGGPPNLCGDLHISRNFAPYTVASGWMCLDPSGNGTMGPWTYAGQVGDEDASAYMVWSDLSSTNTARHIWDKTAPTVTMTPNSGVPAPTALSGTANDGSYGSGFSAAFPADAGGSNSTCALYFYDKTAGWYWCPGDPWYGAQFPCNPSCTISGMPSRSVTWSAGSSILPPGFTHVSGHCYEWGVVITDNWRYGKEGRATHTFCVP